MCRTSSPPTKPTSLTKHTHKTYKMLTADFSQICDGRSLIQLEDHVHRRTYMSSNRQEGQQDAQHACQLSLENALSSFKSYRPVSQKQLRQNKEDTCCDENATVATQLTSSTKSTNFSRRSSTGSSSPNTNTTSNHRPQYQKRHSCPETTSSGPQALVRQKSKPRHRNTSLNQSLPSIVKLPRYSPASGSDYSHQQRRVSLPSNLSPPPFDDGTSLLSAGTSALFGRRSSSSLSLGTNVSSHSLPSDMSVRRSWVAMGVEFSPNMELYVYKK